MIKSQEISSVPSVALKDVSVDDLCLILKNLRFSTLLDSFEKNGISGKAIARMKTHQAIVDIGKGQIAELVAETFFEDYVVEWKSTGQIPRDLLQLPPTPNLKVSCYLLAKCLFS